MTTGTSIASTVLQPSLFDPPSQTPSARSIETFLSEALLQQQTNEQRRSQLPEKPKNPKKRREVSNRAVKPNKRTTKPRPGSAKSRRTNSTSTASTELKRLPVAFTKFAIPQPSSRDSLDRAICNTEQYIASLETKYRNLLALADRESTDLPFLTCKLASLSAQIDEYTVHLIALKKQQLF